MTKYEVLMNKAEKCLECAKATEGEMREIWLSHAEELKLKARSLTLEEAESEAT